jgi:type IV fimbrial biogenesis protein FimT
MWIRSASVARQNGFTIIELMITVLIAAILFALALPNFTQFLRRMQVSQDKNDLIADINFAKAEAIKRGYAVGIYTAGGSTDWSNGWTVWADSNGDQTLTAADTQLRQHDALPNGYKLLSSQPAGSTLPLMFNAQGAVQLPLAATVYFVACNPNHVAADARTVQIAPSGAIIGVNGTGASGVICP